ncbi:MAG TPA: hypothetical protein VK395_03470 [Gemmataceae bacterium]|nr:hypothetical protein [Gemmataceae bacterium]
MTDYQRVVDEIRSFLHANDQTYRDSLKPLSLAYNEVCQEVNQRLRRCEEFLQKGLRSEAVHFAHAEPVLLDVLAAVDFPERSQWEELSLLYGLPPPPYLRVDTAEALNTAYAEEQPLERLLREHRLLALTGAPLVDRLKVMRAIAHVDAANPVWTEDIKEFETIRLQKMDEDITRALADKDTEGLFDLWEELQGSPWLAEAAGQLAARIEDRVNQLAHIKLRKRMEQVAEKLHRSHAARNESKSRELRDEWNRLNLQARLVRQDPLWREIGPALQWLASLDRDQAEEFEYQAALEKLEQAFAKEASQGELQELYYEARKFKRGMPLAVEEHYRNRVAKIQTTENRRERYILVAAASFGLLILVGFLIFVLAHKGR